MASSSGFKLKLGNLHKLKLGNLHKLKLGNLHKLKLGNLHKLKLGNLHKLKLMDRVIWYYKLIDSSDRLLTSACAAMEIKKVWKKISPKSV